MRPITRETILDRRQPYLRWSPIFGGALLASGIWILLQVLGMGIGLSAVQTDDAGSLKGAGVGTGIWTIIAPLIALFVGGWLTGRTSGARDRKVGAMHGSVMWALALAVGMWAMMSMLAALAGGVGRVAVVAGDATASVTSGVVSGVAENSGGAMSALGIDANDMLGPINQRLRAEGKPEITADQLNATVKSLAQRGVRQGHLDRQVIVDEVARNTSLSRTDAEQVADDLERKYQDVSGRARQKLDEVEQQAKHVSLEAADKTGKALLIGGVMMLLSLAAAIGGGALGVPRVRVEERPVITTTTPEPLD